MAEQLAEEAVDAGAEAGENIDFGGFEVFLPHVFLDVVDGHAECVGHGDREKSGRLLSRAGAPGRRGVLRRGQLRASDRTRERPGCSPPTGALRSGAAVHDPEVHPPPEARLRWAMLALLAIAEVLGMSLWFSASAIWCASFVPKSATTMKTVATWDSAKTLRTRELSRRSRHPPRKSSRCREWVDFIIATRGGRLLEQKARVDLDERWR